MNLSDLQTFILKQTYLNGPQCPRKVFDRYYKKSGDEESSSVTRSIERLITRGLLRGYGYQTSEKWFIQKVSLTPLGKKEVRRFIRDQQKLPF